MNQSLWKLGQRVKMRCPLQPRGSLLNEGEIIAISPETVEVQTLNGQRHVFEADGRLRLSASLGRGWVLQRW